MGDNNTLGGNITTTDKRIVLFQKLYGLGRCCRYQLKQKIEEKEKKKENNPKNLPVAIMWLHVNLVAHTTQKMISKFQNWLNLLQENKGMSVRVAAGKANLAYSTAKRVHQWNESFNNDEEGFPDSCKKKKTGAKSELNDEHTVFIFAKTHEQPTISYTDVTDLLCKHSKV